MKNRIQLLLVLLFANSYTWANSPDGPIPSVCRARDYISFSSVTHRTVIYSDIDYSECRYTRIEESSTMQDVREACRDRIVQEGYDVTKGQWDCLASLGNLPPVIIRAGGTCSGNRSRTETTYYNARYYFSSEEMPVRRCEALSNCLESANLSKQQRKLATAWYNEFKCNL